MGDRSARAASPASPRRSSSGGESAAHRGSATRPLKIGSARGNSETSVAKSVRLVTPADALKEVGSNTASKSLEALGAPIPKVVTPMARASAPSAAAVRFAAPPAVANLTGGEGTSAHADSTSNRSQRVSSKAGHQLVSSATAKQQAEKEAREQRRLEAQRQEQEHERMRERAAQLEKENAHLSEQVTIWKNAQSAASSLREEMDSLRRRHNEVRAELASEKAMVEKLRKEKAEMADEMK